MVNFEGSEDIEGFAELEETEVAQVAVESQAFRASSLYLAFALRQFEKL